MPGLGRMAICLSDQIKEQGKDGYSGRAVSKECSQELDKFRKDQSGNINLDLPLGMSTACFAAPLQRALPVANLCLPCPELICFACASCASVQCWPGCFAHHTTNLLNYKFVEQQRVTPSVGVQFLGVGNAQHSQQGNAMLCVVVLTSHCVLQLKHVLMM